MSINIKKLTAAISAVAVMGVCAADVFAATYKDRNGNTIYKTVTSGNTTYIKDRNGNTIGKITR